MGLKLKKWDLTVNIKKGNKSLDYKTAKGKTSLQMLIKWSLYNLQIDKIDPN